jgi:hypothetical protein
VLGRSVELAFGGERSDRYGRLQAQAFMREGELRRWVQGHLVGQGLSRAYSQAGNRACTDALLAAEREPREARRGLWANAAYQIRPGDRASEITRYRSTFQVVEGRIERVGQGRGGIVYLNFESRCWTSRVLRPVPHTAMLLVRGGTNRKAHGHRRSSRSPNQNCPVSSRPGSDFVTSGSGNA